MVIKSMRVTNIKKLKDCLFVPPEDASICVLAGKNDQGKSTSLDCVAYALGGATLICDEPIRRGESTASVKVDLGSIVVTRKWTKKGSRLEVVDKSVGCEPVPQPQGLLDRLVGTGMLFDPLAFSRMPPREQARVLAELLKIDFVAADTARVSAVEERTAARREQKAAQEKAEKLGETITDFSAREVSISDLVSLIQAGTLKNQHRAGLKQTVEDAEKAIQAADEKVRRLQQEIEEATAALRVRETEKEEATRLFGAAPEFDVSGLQTQLASAETRNAEARRVCDYNTLVASVEIASKEAEAADTKVLKIDSWKKRQLVEAPFPIPGLAFAEDGSGVLLNDLPFEQAGDAAKVKVGVAMGLAMSKEVKVLLIRDGSLLDEDSMAAIEAMAAEAGAQIWVERVGMDGPATWVIEQGEIARGPSDDTI